MSENRNPVVSVIIPTYNRSSFLNLTLKSIDAQRFKDFEVIVVDDGSPNNEAELVCMQFSFCRYIRIENSGGPAKPRNTGIGLAQGKYLAFVDDDDLWTPEKLSRQVEILDSMPDFGLVHSFCSVIDSQGNDTGKFVGRLNDTLKHGYVFDRMVGNFTVMMPTPLIRKEVIDQAGGFNEEIPPALEDTEFFVRLAFYTRFFFVNEPLVKYRVHDDGLSNHNKKYIHLPWYLFEVVKGFYETGLLERERYILLRNKLLLVQIREASCWGTFLIAMTHCAKMYPLFVLVPGVVRKIVSKKLELLRAK